MLQALNICGGVFAIASFAMAFFYAQQCATDPVRYLRPARTPRIALAHLIMRFGSALLVSAGMVRTALWWLPSKYFESETVFAICGTVAMCLAGVILMYLDYIANRLLDQKVS